MTTHNDSFRTKLSACSRELIKVDGMPGKMLGEKIRYILVDKCDSNGFVKHMLPTILPTSNLWLLRVKYIQYGMIGNLIEYGDGGMLNLRPRPRQGTQGKQRKAWESGFSVVFGISG